MDARTLIVKQPGTNGKGAHAAGIPSTKASLDSEWDETRQCEVPSYSWDSYANLRIFFLDFSI